MGLTRGRMNSGPGETDVDGFAVLMDQARRSRDMSTITGYERLDERLQSGLVFRMDVTKEAVSVQLLPGITDELAVRASFATRQGPHPPARFNTSMPPGMRPNSHWNCPSLARRSHPRLPVAAAGAAGSRAHVRASRLSRSAMAPPSKQTSIASCPTVSLPRYH